MGEATRAVKCGRSKVRGIAVGDRGYAEPEMPRPPHAKLVQLDAMMVRALLQ
jgi:hypothetical protein